MSHPWTRVPPGVPPLDRTQLRLLPVADFFMALMWSRPGGLSLKTTWVTPATLALALSVCLVGLAGAAAALVAGTASGQWLLILAGLFSLALAIGAGSLAIYGLRQRRLPQA